MLDEHSKFQSSIACSNLIIPNIRHKKINKIDKDVIQKILNQNRGNHLSALKIKNLYNLKTGEADFYTSTLRKFLKTRMKLRFKKAYGINAYGINVNRNQNRHLVMQHLCFKNYIHLQMNSKYFIYTDESSFNGYNSHFKTWVHQNEPQLHELYGRFKSFCLIASISEVEIIYYEIKETTVKGKDFLSYFKNLYNHVTLKNNLLNPFLQKDYVFYLDNASIHCDKQVNRFFVDNEVSVLYGVPFSPEYNPNELFFADIKKAYYNIIMKSK